MEEYQNKVNYLQHIKKIAEIQDGLGKPSALSSIFNQSYKRIVQRTSIFPKGVRNRNIQETQINTSKQRIMRNFTVRKENNRLASKITNMNSSLSLKYYQTQYQISKSYPLQHPRQPKIHKYFYFKLFDIKLGKGTASNPDDSFKVFVLQNNKKTMLTKDTLFELRKKELRLKRKTQILLKIEGLQHEGLVKFQQKNLIEITRNGHKVGHLIVQHLQK